MGLVKVYMRYRSVSTSRGRRALIAYDSRFDKRCPDGVTWGDRYARIASFGNSTNRAHPAAYHPLYRRAIRPPTVSHITAGCMIISNASYVASHDE